MRVESDLFLVLGGLGSALAALMHLGCIIFGASWYRFFGAGEKMARLAESGSAKPAMITAVIFLMLICWSYCAFAGAGLAPRPPLLRLILIGIAAIYLLRGCLFPVLMKIIPGNSLTFWIVSSVICFCLGLTYLIGIKQNWAGLNL